MQTTLKFTRIAYTKFYTVFIEFQNNIFRENIVYKTINKYYKSKKKKKLQKFLQKFKIKKMYI